MPLVRPWIALACACLVASACTGDTDDEVDPSLAETEQATTITNFAAGSLIIPMDNNFQDRGTLRAYGLLYQLLSNGVKVSLAIKEAKVATDADVTVTSGITNRETNTAIAGPVSYFSGPFVIAATDRAVALPVIDAWLATDTVTVVHDIGSAFTVPVSKSLTSAPRIAVFNDGNQDIAYSYLNAAGIPDSVNAVWADSSVDVLSEAQISGATTTNHADGGLLNADGTPKYCHVMSMHYNPTAATPEVVEEVRSWLAFPSNHAMMECHATEAFEDQGHYLTTNGIDNSGTANPVENLAPDDPFNQFSGTITSVGGSVASIVLANGSTLKSNVKTLLHQNGSAPGIDILWMSGTLDGDPAKGRITYLGGHEYTTNVPISNNPQTNGTRLVLNSLFMSGCADFTAPQPAVTLTKTAPATTGGNSITFTLAFANTGTATATNVTLTDPVPTNTTFTSATGGGTLVGSNVVWNLGSLAPGASGSVTFTVSISVNATISNTATLTFTPPTTTTKKKVTSNTTQTVRNNNAADLAITMTEAPDPVNASSALTYTLNVSNNGPLTANNLTVTDTLPAGVTFVAVSGTGWSCSAAGQVVTCTRTTLAVGAAPPITINATAPAAGGTIVNIATVEATSPTDFNTANNTATSSTVVTARGDLAITIDDAPDPVVVGGTLTYTMTVSNGGPSDATSVVATFTAPAGTTVTSASGAGWTCGVVGQVVTCTRAVLAAAGAAPFTVVVTAPTAPTTLTSTASVSAATSDPDPSNNTATEDTTVALDLDGDGLTDPEDLDDDNDGIPDVDEAAVDTDGDGVTDDRDLDSDNDGLPDVVEAGHGLADADGDGLVDCPGGFGVNGFCDAAETSADSGTAKRAPIDTDGDQVPDFRDIDSDDDSITDRAENGATCADDPENAICDGNDDDGDGSPSSADAKVGFGLGGYPPPPDTDGDGTPDYQDLDSDGDSIFDIDEANHGQFDGNDDGKLEGPDTDGDGLKDSVDDSDLDGTTDATDPDPATFGGGSGPVIDTDMDGMPDFRDLDADGDTLSDHDEAGEDPANPVDTDGDGMPDFQDVDSDNDGVDDGGDNCLLVVNNDQVDGNADGTGDACQDAADGFGIRGGGCNTTDGGGGAFGLALVALALGRRRRRQNHAVAASIAMLVLVVTGTRRADAQMVSTAYPAERFQLASDREGILGVEWADVRGHLSIDGALWVGYANDPINVYRLRDGERVASLVADRVGGELVGSLRLYDRLELALGAPLIMSQSESVPAGGGFMNPNGELSGVGLGDLRVMPKLALLHQGRRSPISLAVMATISLPTSTADDYGGDSGATFAPGLIASHGRALGIRTSVVLGYRARKPVQALDLTVDDELYLQAGVGFRFRNRVEIDATFDFASGANDLGGPANRNHAELRGGVAGDATRNVRVFGAVGTGIAQGFGTPDWRFLAGVRLMRDEPALKHKPVKKLLLDSDGDGLTDDVDRCPTVAETKNAYQDDDGCPDDPDPDKDGILADADACPKEPEDVDSFEDTDGCPDPDNDKDGVLDPVDECPMVPGIPVMKGCPDPDRDNDTVVDRLDNCPDEPGPVENQGCKLKQLVKIVEGKLEILDIVYFALNQAVIERRSYKLLDEVARVINAHPEITKLRVEGHTDSQGNDDYNKKLSQRRSEAVMAYLIKKGVVQGRLDAKGFGEEVPKASNETKEGRATNRRVEFTIIGGLGVQVKPTGPGADTMEKQ